MAVRVSDKKPHPQSRSTKEPEPFPSEKSVLKPGRIGGLQTSSVDDITADNINFLLYGDSGSGKTRLAASACEVPELSPVLFLDIEAGKKTLRKHFRGNKNLEVITITKWPQLQKIYNDLYEGKHEFRTVVVDSETEGQKLAMKYRLGDETAKLPDATVFDSDTVPEIRDWYVNTEQLRRLTRAFRDLPMNTIFTALATEKEVTKNKVTKWPLFTKGLANELPGLFDAVLYLYVKAVKDAEDNKRMLLTDTVEGVMAKSRLMNLPLTMENPSMTDIYKAQLQ